MKTMELIDYINYLKNNNTLNGIQLDELLNILTGKEGQEYELTMDSIQNMVFKHKGTGKIVVLECVKKYYELDESGSGRVSCPNIKKQFKDRNVANCRPENCAKCHACCIQDFYNGKLNKK